MDVYGVVMQHFTPRGMFNTGDAKRWLHINGHNESGAYAVCSDLAALGYLHQLGGGTYRFRCQGLDPDWSTARERLKNMPHRRAWKRINHPADSALRSLVASPT